MMLAWCVCPNNHYFKSDISGLVPSGMRIFFKGVTVLGQSCPTCNLQGKLVPGQQYVKKGENTYITYMSHDLGVIIDRLKTAANASAANVSDDIKIQLAIGEISEFAPQFTALAQTAAQHGGLRLLIAFIGYLIFLYTASAQSGDSFASLSTYAETYVSENIQHHSPDVERYYQLALTGNEDVQYVPIEVGDTMIGIEADRPSAPYMLFPAVQKMALPTALHQQVADIIRTNHTQNTASVTDNKKKERQTKIKKSVAKSSVPRVLRKRDYIDQLSSAHTLAISLGNNDEFAKEFAIRWPHLRDISNFISLNKVPGALLIAGLIGWSRKKKISEFRSTIDWNIALDQILVRLTGAKPYPNLTKSRSDIKTSRSGRASRKEGKK